MEGWNMEKLIRMGLANNKCIEMFSLFKCYLQKFETLQDAVHSRG